MTFVKIDTSFFFITPFKVVFGSQLAYFMFYRLYTIVIWNSRFRCYKTSN